MNKVLSYCFCLLSITVAHDLLALLTCLIPQTQALVAGKKRSTEKAWPKP